MCFVIGIIFAIDVSYPMIKEGIVQLICANIKSMIADLPRDSFCDKVVVQICKVLVMLIILVFWHL